jgi:hypothetical protein
MDVLYLIGILFGAMALLWAWLMPHEEGEAKAMCVASEGTCGREGPQGLRGAEEATIRAGWRVGGGGILVASVCLGTCVTLALLATDGWRPGFWCLRTMLSAAALGACLGTCSELSSGRRRVGNVLLLSRVGALMLSLCCIACIALP